MQLKMRSIEQAFIFIYHKLPLLNKFHFMYWNTITTAWVLFTQEFIITYSFVCPFKAKL